MTNEQIMEYKNYIMSLTKYFEGYKNKEDLEKKIIKLLKQDLERNKEALENE